MLPMAVPLSLVSNVDTEREMEVAVVHLWFSGDPFYGQRWLSAADTGPVGPEWW